VSEARRDAKYLPRDGQEQTSHTFESAAGTIIGFLSPQYMEGIGVPGIHLHFIKRIL
jgi:alpha-acetolactate decarboxylase